MAVDVRTLLLIIALVMVTRAAILAYLWHVDRTFRPVRAWAIGAVLFAAGSVLFGLRGVAPDVVSVHLAHGAVLAGWLVTAMGTVQATGYKTPWFYASLVTLGGYGGLLYFVEVSPDFVLRTLAVTIPQVALDLYVGMTCWRPQAADRRTTLRILGVIMLGSAVSNALKMLSVSALQMNTLFEVAPEYVQYFVYSIINSVAFTAFCILLSAQELQRQLAQVLQAQVLATQDAVAARREAEVANQAKSTFLANMSHEIRTPIHAVISMAHMVRDAGLSPEQLRLMQKLEVASDHLLSLINAVLDFSKIEAGKLVLNKDALHIPSIVERVSAVIEFLATQKGLQWCPEIGPVHARVVGDATQLQQALLNLASNAVKFTSQGQVSLRVVQMEEDEHSVLLKFEVQDTGIGIAPQTLSRLFTPFEQGDSSTNRKYGGTGLGLAYTRNIARLMGGDCDVRSDENVGSCFWFTARLAKDSRPQASVVADEVHGDIAQILHRDFSGTRVLVAEDDLFNQEIAEILLRKIGFEVSLAANGVDACNLVQGSRFELIIMDMQMPEMDGLEATRRIRQMPGYQQIPIIAMTANAFAEDRSQCLDAGMSDFVSKPVKPEDLYKILLRWLR